MWYYKILPQTYVVAVAMLAGAVFLRRLSPLALIIWGLVIANVVIDVYATYLAIELKQQTHNLYNKFIIAENILILLIFSTAYPKGIAKNTIYCLVVLLLTFSIINYYYIEGPSKFNIFTFVAGGLLIATISYLKIRVIILKDDTQISDILPWFLAANFVYYIISVSILASILLIIKNIDLTRFLLSVKNVAYMLWGLIIATGFVCQKMKT